jgi:phenylalanyl-tRNA synthetase beta chain
MVELGQPTHAYDLDRLSGGVTVRRARAGETLTTLDGKLRTLDPEDLLITDESGPIGLAGVMSGASTEIDPATSTAVFVEGANFDPVTIARSARRHKLPSEASRRFERGVDPRAAAPAVARVVGLLVELAGGTADSLGSDIDESLAPAPINLPEGYVGGLIGADFSADEITNALEAVGAAVEATETGWRVTPPTWRPDLTIAASLAEEVARTVGYDRIPSVLPVAPPGRGLSREQRLRRLVASSLASAGLTEVLSYPFLAQVAHDRFGAAQPGAVPAMAIANPLDPDTALLRSSLLPGLATIAHRNLSRGLTDLSLFEVGTVFRPEVGVTYGSGPLPAGDSRPTDEVLGALRASIPPQPWHVSALFIGNAVAKQPGQPAIATGIADALAAAHHIAGVVAAALTVAVGSHQALHPGRTAELRVGDTVVGFAGELLPSLAAELDLPRIVGVLELDLDALLGAGATQIAAAPISSFPAATQDVSLVVPAEAPAGDLLAILREGAGELLEHAELTDDYRGPGVSEGSKSLTYALRFRASDRTLTQAEATEAKTAAVALAATRLGATLRE